MLNLAQLLRIPRLDAGFDISPDGIRLAFAWNHLRCPASDSIDARDKLIEPVKEVELFLYEDEGHAFLKVENVLDVERKRVEFLEKVLSR